jgi:hypothetical protein
MQNITFVVKVNRGSTRAPEYMQRVDPTPVQMITNNFKLCRMRFLSASALMQFRDLVSWRDSYLRRSSGITAAS